MLPIDLPNLRHNLRRARLPDLYRFAVRRLNEEHLPQVAGSLTFTTVLAIVPMLAIALAIFTAFPVFDNFRNSLEAYFIQNLMPRTISNSIMGYLNQFASKSMRLSAIGGVFLFVTAVTTMSMIDQVLNRIWQVRTQRSLAQRVLVYWALITLGPLLLGISISLTSYLFTATGGLVSGIPFAGVLFYTALSVLLTTGAFTLLYVVVPNRAVDWRDAAWGGLLAAVAFEIAKRLFAAYITKFPTYTVVYGAIAAVPIFLLWIYIFWLITLIGAVLAAALPVVKYERWWHVATPGSAFVDAMMVLEALYEARTNSPSSAIDGAMIRKLTRLGFDESEALLQKMLDAGWVGRIKGDVPRRFNWGRRVTEGTDRWTLLANPQQLKVADVYRLFVFNVGGHMMMARDVEAAIETGLAQTLAEHFGKD